MPIRQSRTRLRFLIGGLGLDDPRDAHCDQKKDDGRAIHTHAKDSVRFGWLRWLAIARMYHINVHDVGQNGWDKMDQHGDDRDWRLGLSLAALPAGGWPTSIQPLSTGSRTVIHVSDT